MINDRVPTFLSAAYTISKEDLLDALHITAPADAEITVIGYVNYVEIKVVKK